MSREQFDAALDHNEAVATETERAHVVAWLRERAQEADALAEALRQFTTGDRGRAMRGSALVYRTAADAIEAGGHRMTDAGVPRAGLCAWCGLTRAEHGHGAGGFACPGTSSSFFTEAP